MMKITTPDPAQFAAGRYFTFQSGEGSPQIVSFDGPSCLLHSRLKDFPFELADVVNILLEEYEVSIPAAQSAAIQWVEQARHFGLLVD